jgi:hypothetical protein
MRPHRQRRRSTSSQKITRNFGIRFSWQTRARERRRLATRAVEQKHYGRIQFLFRLKVAKEWDGRLARQRAEQKDGRDARPTLSVLSLELSQGFTSATLDLGVILVDFRHGQALCDEKTRVSRSPHLRVGFSQLNVMH